MIMYSSIWRLGRLDAFAAFGDREWDSHGARRIYSLTYGMIDWHF
jgi:hypothetical protein